MSDLDKLRAAWVEVRKTKEGREVTDALTPFVKEFGITEFVYLRFAEPVGSKYPK